MDDNDENGDDHINDEDEDDADDDKDGKATFVNDKDGVGSLSDL